MLNFNAPPLKNTAVEPVWKVTGQTSGQILSITMSPGFILSRAWCPQVLVYDRFGQDIISPLLSVKELRDMGITLHL